MLKKVLIVDDYEELHDMLAMVFKDYELIDAYNGFEGYVKAVQEKPDVIITDMKMPVMNGVQLAQKLKANSKTQDIPLILISGYAKDAEPDGENFAKIFNLPLDLAEFKKNVDELLGIPAVG